MPEIPAEAITAPQDDDDVRNLVLAAAFQAQRDFRAENGNPDWDSDWDDEAEAVTDAVWPHVVAAAAPALYAEAAEAERERIRRELTDAIARYEYDLAFTAPELYPMRLQRLKNVVADLLEPEGDDDA